MARPAPKPSGLTKAPRKEHPLAPDVPTQPVTVAQVPHAGRDAETPTPMTVRVAPSIQKRVKMAGVERDRKVQDIVAEALVEWLDRHS